jgi:iron complex transport system ATP-binding protein
VLLARALAGEPELLILDEPVANLDPRHRLAIMDTLAALADRGVTVIASLHDLDLAQRCRRVWLLDRGALVADGSPDNVLDAARLAAVFGVVRDGQGWVRAD